MNATKAHGGIWALDDKLSQLELKFNLWAKAVDTLEARLLTLESSSLFELELESPGALSHDAQWIDVENCVYHA